MTPFPTKGSKLSLVGRFVAYPIGKLSLRILTLGKYPPEKENHNELFVAIFAWAVFSVFAVFYWS